MSGFETGHIRVERQRFSAFKRFLSGSFGFELKGESTDEERKFAMLANDGKLVLTLWQQSSAEFSNQTARIATFSFQAKSVEQIKEIEAKLREKG